MPYHPYFTWTQGPAAPVTTTTGGGGFIRAWNPLLPFRQEDRQHLLEAVRLIEEESGVKRERAKARKLERDLKAAEDSADIRALVARITWAVERAAELRREEDDEEDAIVLLALLH